MAGVERHSCNSADSDKKATTGDTSNETPSNSAMDGDKAGMPDVAGWPERPRLAGNEMTAKYGPPTEVSIEAIQ